MNDATRREGRGSGACASCSLAPCPDTNLSIYVADAAGAGAGAARVAPRARPGGPFLPFFPFLGAALAFFFLALFSSSANRERAAFSAAASWRARSSSAARLASAPRLVPALATGRSAACWSRSRRSRRPSAELVALSMALSVRRACCCRTQIVALSCMCRSASTTPASAIIKHAAV